MAEPASRAQAALAALAARPGGQRQIRGDRDLTQEERITIIQMIKKAIQVSTPSAEVTEDLVHRVFNLVFAPQWVAAWPPTVPVQKERRFEDIFLKVGVWCRDLPAPARGHEGKVNLDDGMEGNDDEEDVTTVTPRKRARIRAAGVSTQQVRKRGAAAFLRPVLRDSGVLDFWFADSHGRRAPDNCVAYFGADRGKPGDGGEKLAGEVIARAVLHYDTSEMQRIRTFNQALLIFFIRAYIHELVTGRDVGNETSHKYCKPVLMMQGLEGVWKAMEELKRTSEGRAVEQHLFD